MKVFFKSLMTMQLVYGLSCSVSEPESAESTDGASSTDRGTTGTGGAFDDIRPENCENIPPIFPSPKDWVGFKQLNSDSTESIVIEGAQFDNLIKIELKLQTGIFSSAAQPGTYTVEGVENNLSSCSLCATIAGTFNSENNQFLHLLSASSGTLTLFDVGTTAGATIAGNIANMQFREVEDDADSYQDKPNGCRTFVEDIDFNITLQLQPN